MQALIAHVLQGASWFTPPAAGASIEAAVRLYCETSSEFFRSLKANDPELAKQSPKDCFTLYDIRDDLSRLQNLRPPRVTDHWPSLFLGTGMAALFSRFQFYPFHDFAGTVVGAAATSALWTLNVKNTRGKKDSPWNDQDDTLLGVAIGFGMPWFFENRWIPAAGAALGLWALGSVMANTVKKWREKREAARLEWVLRRADQNFDRSVEKFFEGWPEERARLHEWLKQRFPLGGFPTDPGKDLARPN